MIDTQEMTTVVLERTFRHSMEKVWRALTDSSLLAEWMLPNDFQAEVGKMFTLRAKPMPQWDGIVEGEVLEIIPQRRLRYAWRSPASIEINVELTPVDEGVHLKVELSGPEKPAVGGAKYGWEQLYLPALERVLEQTN
jgi:uncharacterized protein YndB with AHSA1/START domain